jgi:diguanylate cyclase (GGDEF)-like protein/PAS domain S-box-containing protein
MSGRLRFSWLHRHGVTLRLTLCFFSVYATTVFVRFMPETNHMIWFANGVLLAFMILAPRRRWPAYLIAGLSAQLAGSMVFNAQWRLNIVLTAMNLAEVLISAYLLRRGSTARPHFTDRSYLIRFVCFGILAGPLAMGLVYALIAAYWQHTAPVPALIEYVIADGLGIALATPACVAILRIRSSEITSFGKYWYYLIPVVAISLAGFSQSRIPLQFFLFPLLVLVLLRLGLGWASMALLFVAAVGSWFTVRGLGPFASPNYLTPLEPAVVIQVYLASVMFLLYTISVVMESRRAIERRLRKIVTQHALVTENSRDAIILADFNGNRRFVSAAAKQMVGWTPLEVLNQKSTELIHPDDLPKAAAVVRQLYSGAEDAMLVCRVMKRNREYLWVEASLRVVRNPATGVPIGILNMVRDITERKQAEQKLQEAYKAVETLAVTDALTGLANRRQFDQCLTNEWRRGLRDRNPLAMLLIDVDLFKSYNDTYGHVRGDSCLKQIAEAALDVVVRPGDLVTRFGGEEFAVILPHTCIEGALQVANEICEGLRRRRLEHSTNPLGVLTISVGCASVVPSLGQHAVNLIELADEALYTAKRNGRNQVRSCNALSSSGAVIPAVALAEISIARTA